jgi:hypothetical protein
MKMMHDRIRIYFQRLAALHKEGFRCRFDPAVIAVMPLEGGEKLQEKEFCSPCKWDGRADDQFCLQWIKVWEVLSDYDPGRYGPEADPRKAT